MGANSEPWTRGEGTPASLWVWSLQLDLGEVGTLSKALLGGGCGRQLPLPYSAGAEAELCKPPAFCCSLGS